MFLSARESITCFNHFSGDDKAISPFLKDFLGSKIKLKHSIESHFNHIIKRY